MKNLLVVLAFLLLNSFINAQEEKKIYENDIFSIQYPTNWNLEETEGTQAQFIVKGPLTSDKDIFAENVNVITQDLKGMGVTLDQYVDFNKSQLTTIPNGEMLSSTRKNRDGNDYHTLIFKGTMNSYNLKIMQLYAIKNEVAYVLTFTVMEDEYAQFEKLGKQILNSFKLK